MEYEPMWQKNSMFNKCLLCGEEVDVETREAFEKLFKENGGACLCVRCLNCHIMVHNHEDNNTNYMKRLIDLANVWNKLKASV